MWNYTGKGKKRSPAQQRQNHLFMKKGQIAAMQSVLSGIIGDPMIPPSLRLLAGQALDNVELMVESFDKEVGWK